MLYRTFRSDKGPRLSMVVRVLSSVGFQLIVNAHRSHPQNGRPSRNWPLEKNYCSSRTSLESKGMCQVFDKSIRDFGHGCHRESPRRYAACPRKYRRIFEKGVDSAQQPLSLIQSKQRPRVQQGCTFSTCVGVAVRGSAAGRPAQRMTDGHAGCGSAQPGRSRLRQGGETGFLRFRFTL